jgi:prevent-host-death family protein
MDSLPYSEVRAHLAETLKQLEVRDEPLLISRRGQPAGVLMSVAHYQRLQARPGGFGDALLAWRERYAAELAAEAAAGDWVDPFADVRDRSLDGGRPPIDFSELLGDDKPQENAAPVAAAVPQPDPGEQP